MTDSQPDRSEQPTARKKQRARTRGQVPRSRELQAALGLLGGMLALRWFEPWMTHRVLDGFAGAFRALDREPLVAEAVPQLAAAWMGWAAVLLLPVAGLAVAVPVAGAVAMQGGFVFAPQLLAPSLSRIDALAGMRRMLSAQTLFGLGRDALKVAIVAWVCVDGSRHALAALAGDVDVELPVVLQRTRDVLDRLTWRVGLVLLGAGVADYLWQRMRHTRDLRMSKQEVREEQKEIDGDPVLKSRIRARQRATAQRRMMREVPSATVVITNPTHYAVALRYEPGTMGAPRVVAKGQRLVAERIKRIALEHGVPLVEDQPLARALYRLAPVGAEIPAELYRAVAEVLGYVYRLDRGARAARTTPPRSRP
jgi:flagellar biosynthetic protein FlhB